MQTFMRNTLKLATVLVLLLGLFGAGFSHAQAAALPASSACSSLAGVATCNLWAKAGSFTPPGGASTTIWGFTDSAAGILGAAGGPVLVVNQGDVVTVNLTNNLTETTALLFQGQAMKPDLAGAGAGGTKSYAFTASQPGTFLYEAGLIPGSQHQVAMGLYGALVVRPSAAGQAYADASTSFDEEALLVLSELDPALNNSATPATFDMRKYHPQYFLINGKAYPDTDAISVSAGNKVLLRYVNAGLQAHAMSTLGLTQTIIAQDGSPYAHSHKMVAETIATGQTLDTIVTIPTAAANGTQYPLYDANMQLHNSNTAGVGGMLTTLTVGPVAPPADTGPFVSLPSLSPNPTGGSSPSPVTVKATISDAGTVTVNTIAAAEFYIDSTAGTAYSMLADDAAFDEPIEAVTSTSPISTTMLQSLASGNHTIYIRGRDSNGTWSSFLSVTLNLDKNGPATLGLSLSPNPSSGAVSVALSATGNDIATGNSNVITAEYWVDGGVHTVMTASGSAAPTRGFTATIPAGLSMGTHVVSVRSQDAFGNWGATATINLQVADTAAPTTSSVSASPNPNNGTWGVNTSTPAVRVLANFSDVATGGSNIAAAEGFIDTVGATGTGFTFVAADGAFNSSAEAGYADVPIAVVGALTEGNHTIYVHAKDAAGNWGTMSTTVLVIKKSLYFSTLSTTNPPGVSGTADDADVYLWNGSAFSRSVDVSVAPYSLPSGANVDGFDRVDATHFYMSFSSDVTIGALSVQDEDIVYYNAGTWSVYFDGTAKGLTSNNQDIDAFSIVGSTIYFSTVGTTNPPSVSGTADDADIYSWNGSSFARVIDVTTAPFSIPGSANVDGLVFVDATHFYLSFAADTTLVGLGAVQDEDVVYYNSGVWLTYFDGTAKGLTNSNQDIDAFDIP
jgi:FtsP/CotA-like multicopper oxidase with cupredoxin domain